MGVKVATEDYWNSQPIECRLHLVFSALKAIAMSAHLNTVPRCDLCFMASKSDEATETSRRGFLKTAAATVGGLVVGAAAGYTTGLSGVTTTTQTVTTTLTGGLGEFKGTLKVGGTVSTTGPTAQSISKEIDMYKVWADMVNERGGVYIKELGGPAKVEMVTYADNGPGDVATIDRLYTRLVQEDRVQVLVGPFTAAPAFSASAVAERLSTPYIDNQAAETPIFKRPNNWVVGSLDTMTEWLKHYFDLLKAKTNAKTVAFINTPDSFGKEVNGFGETPLGGKQYAEQLGFRVVAAEEIPFDFATDYTPVIQKMRQADPDVIVFSDPVAVFDANFWKQCRDNNYKPRAFHPIFGALLAFQGTTGPDLGSGISADVYWNDSQRFEGVWGKKFWEELQQRAGFTDADWPWLSIGYVCLEIAVAAAYYAGSLDKARIMNALHTQEITTLQGPWRAVIPTDADVRGRNMGTIRAFPVQMIKGKRVVVWPPEIATGEYVYPEPFTF